MNDDYLRAAHRMLITMAREALSTYQSTGDTVHLSNLEALLEAIRTLKEALE